MSDLTVPRSAGADHGVGGSDGAVSGDRDSAVTVERQSVSELVRNDSDSPSESQKRDRSESGDAAPSRKRGKMPDQSPSVVGGRGFKECLETAIDNLESRLMVSFSKDLHDFRETLASEVDRLHERVKDLERHVEERDGLIDQLTDDLRRSRDEVTALQFRMEEAEINSRLPCLVLSGAAMAPRRVPRLGPPLPPPGATGRAGAGSAGPGPGQGQVTSQPADVSAGGGERRPGGPSPAVGGGSGGREASRGVTEEREDINALVVTTLTQCMPGLRLDVSDIDRAHRLPGPNNRVIVRFLRSGQDSVRDQVMMRRMELRGRELYVNESLNKLRGLIFRSLLAAKREKKIYTVYSRGGNVFFKDKQHGVSTRVDSVRRLRELGYGVLER